MIATPMIAIIVCALGMIPKIGTIGSQRMNQDHTEYGEKS